MNTLIIGGRGYIGTKLFNVLTQAGIPTTRLGSRSQDYNSLTVSQLSEFHIVVLLAGHSSVPSCRGELRAPWNNNVRNFSNLALKLDPEQRLIYASSSSVYGSSLDQVCTESQTCLTYMNNYDLTKIVLDQHASNLMHQGRNIMGLRFGTVIGASDIIRKDILVNSMTYSAVTTGEIHVSNSQIRRPYLSVSDLCQGILAVIQGQFVSGIYNMANDNHTIMHYAQAVKSYTGADIVDHGNTPGVYDFQISNHKFMDQYDFRYRSDLQQNIPELIRAYADRSIPVVSRDQYFDYQQ